MTQETTSCLSLCDCSTVEVDLGDRSYQILIGEDLLRSAGQLIKSLRPSAKCCIVTDENVAKFHLSTLSEILGNAGIQSSNIILKPGEGTKSFAPLQELTEALIAHELERGDLVIAFGGGVIGDLAGFAASIVRRGIDFVQIPTSLLAQVDSSVGGKTGINSVHGKNLIGAFHQPILVLCDTSVLKTLDQRQFHAGYAEIVKYGLIRDEKFFEWLIDNQTHIFAQSHLELSQAIETSCRMKASIVSEDERENGVRALLNLGHTFGHGLEALTGYCDRLLHGEAIAIGMTLAFEFSERLELCPQDRLTRVVNHFKQANLPTKLQDISGYDELSLEAFLTAMSQDKKVERGSMVFVLPRDIGDAFVHRGVSDVDLRDFLADKFTGK